MWNFPCNPSNIRRWERLEAEDKNVVLANTTVLVSGAKIAQFGKLWMPDVRAVVQHLSWTVGSIHFQSKLLYLFHVAERTYPDENDAGETWDTGTCNISCPLLVGSGFPGVLKTAVTSSSRSISSVCMREGVGILNRCKQVTVIKWCYSPASR